MSLEIIHEKLEASAYSSLFDVISDFGQMWNNAKRCKLRNPSKEASTDMQTTSRSRRCSNGQERCTRSRARSTTTTQLVRTVARAKTNCLRRHHDRSRPRRRHAQRPLLLSRQRHHPPLQVHQHQLASQCFLRPVGRVQARSEEAT